MDKYAPLARITTLAIAIAMVIVGNVIYQLYIVQFEIQKTNLINLANSQARLLEFSADHSEDEILSHFNIGQEKSTRIISGNTDGEKFTHDLSEMIVEQLEMARLGNSSEFMVGRKIDDTIEFVITGSRSNEMVPMPVPFDGTLAEPMRRALNGNSGFIVAEDYSGVEVMAVYQPIEKLNIGLVAKIDLDEVQAPFIFYVWISIFLGLLIILGTYLTYVFRVKPLRAKLKETEKIYQYIFDKSEDPMWLMSEGKFTHCNDAAVRAYNCDTKEDFYNSHPSLFAPKKQEDGTSSAQKADEMMSIAMEKGYHRFYWLGQRLGNHEIFPCEVTLTKIHIHDEIALYAVVRDITVEKDFEENLCNALKEAEHANIAKSEFLASMSHEFRTPLNAILGFSEMLKEEYFGPLGSDKYKEYVGDIHTSGSHLLDLINDILDISAIEARKRPMRKSRFNLTALINECIALVKNSANDKNISIKLELQGNMGSIYANRRGLKQILINLMTNSVKFTDDGGQVILGALCENNHISIYVEDNGIGIEEEYVSIIFEPFSRIEDSVHFSQEGTGLGLSICQKLINAYEGSINVESTYGLGTKVSFNFPVNQDLQEGFHEEDKIEG